MNNNMNSLKTDMIKDNQDFNERFEALYEKIDTSQGCPQEHLQERRVPNSS